MLKSFQTLFLMNKRPAMKCAEITDKVIETIEGGEYELIKA